MVWGRGHGCLVSSFQLLYLYLYANENVKYVLVRMLQGHLFIYCPRLLFLLSLRVHLGETVRNGRQAGRVVKLLLDSKKRKVVSLQTSRVFLIVPLELQLQLGVVFKYII